MPPIVPPWFVAVALPGWPHGPRRLARLGAWSVRWTPRVHLEHGDDGTGPPLLLLDVGGCLRVHGGAGRLCRRIARAFVRRGVAHAIGSAPSSGEAVVRAMAACAGPAAAAVPVDMLGVDCLRMPAGIVAGLHEVNLRRIGDLRAVARPALADRWGPLPGERIDAALGLRPWPFLPVVAPDPVLGEFRFASPCAQAEAVELAARHAVDELCRALDVRGRAVRTLRVRVEGARLPPVEGTLHLGAAACDARHLWSLLAPRFARLHLGHHERGEGIERIAIEAVRLGKRMGGTAFLPGACGAAGAAASPPTGRASAGGARDACDDGRAAAERAVGELVDHLRARLGDGAVRPPEP